MQSKYPPCAETSPWGSQIRNKPEISPSASTKTTQNTPHPPDLDLPWQTLPTCPLAQPENPRKFRMQHFISPRQPAPFHPKPNNTHWTRGFIYTSQHANICKALAHPQHISLFLRFLHFSSSFCRHHRPHAPPSTPALFTRELGWDFLRFASFSALIPPFFLFASAETQI